MIKKSIACIVSTKKRLIEKAHGVLIKFPRNSTIFGMYNSSSSHSDSLENDFFVLGKGDGSFCALGKAKTTFCLSFHYNSYLFVNEREIYKFKANNKNLSFLPQFSLGSIPNKFDYDDSEEVCFKGNVYDFSVDYDAIDKSDILRIHKYLMIESNVWAFWNYQKNDYCIFN